MRSEHTQQSGIYVSLLVSAQIALHHRATGWGAGAREGRGLARFSPQGKTYGMRVRTYDAEYLHTHTACCKGEICYNSLAGPSRALTQTSIVTRGGRGKVKSSSPCSCPCLCSAGLFLFQLLSGASPDRPGKGGKVTKLQASMYPKRGFTLYTHAYDTSLLTSLWAAGSPPSCIRRPTQLRGAKPDQSADASCGSYTTSPVRPASGAAPRAAVGAGAAVTLTLENGSLSLYPSNLLRDACCCSQDCVCCCCWWCSER